MGCAKVSPGCRACYMFAEQKSYGMDPADVRRSKTKFNEPLKWKQPRRVFTCSWSDFFIEQADAWRPEAWEIIRKTPHTYIILTKRIERVPECLPPDWGAGYPNVWLCVSVESQHFLWRIAQLAEIPAPVHGVSFEPLLGPIDASRYLHLIDWAILGGESGPGARACHVSWIRQLMAQCRSRDVAVFCKQLGANVMGVSNQVREAAGADVGRIRFHDRKGADMAEWPEDLRVREFPSGLTVAL